MGSRARVVVYAPDEPVDAVRRAFAAIDACDDVLSDYRPRSESRVLAASEAGVWHDASPLLVDAIERSRAVWAASDGAFDITIGPVTALWRVADETGASPSDDELAEARARVGMSLIDVDRARSRVRFRREGMRLDFGGIGKGYAADLALQALRDGGLPVALVEIGGDLAVGDAPPGSAGWTVGVSGGGAALVTRVIANEAVATSGDRFRWTELEDRRASHIFDPSSARPAPGGRPIGVIAPEGWIADAVATVTHLRGADAGRRTGTALGGVELVVLE